MFQKSNKRSWRWRGESLKREYPKMPETVKFEQGGRFKSVDDWW
eukprot:SAG22_NODE_1258_length_4983_cov_2.401925_11_plen_44_part_00